MRKFWMMLAITAVLAAILTCGAFAAAGVATQNYTTAKDDATVTCTIENGKVKSYTAKYAGSDLIEGNSYVLLVVRGSESNYTINEQNIIYVDQVDNCDGESVAFENFEPITLADAVVLLGGEFNGSTSPKVLGEIYLRGIKVTAKVNAYNDSVVPAAALYASNDTTHTTPIYAATVGEAVKASNRYTWDISFASVLLGQYDLVVTKAGNLSYTVKGITVGTSDVDLTASSVADISTLSMIAGEFTGDTRINTADFTKFRSNYTKTGDAIVDPATDINGDSRVNTADFTAFRTGYTKTTAACTFTYAEN